MEHSLKIRCGYFDAVQSGAKPFEVRMNDRGCGYQVNDELELLEVVHLEGKDMTTGRSCRRRVTYVLGLREFFELVDYCKHGTTGGSERDVDGWVVLGLAEVCDG